MPESVRVTTHHPDGTTDVTRLRPTGSGRSRLQDRIGPYREGVDTADGSAEPAEPIDAFAAPPRPFWDDMTEPRWRSRLADRRIRSAVLVAVALVFGLVWFLWDTGPRAGSVAAGASNAERSAVTKPVGTGSASPSSSAPTRGSAVDGRVTVHIAGAVKRPGVITLRTGARVIDAIEAVGGALPEADLTHINLAALVADGAQVLVVRNGETPVAPAQPGNAVGGAGAGPVNLNTATVTDLDALPGIGPARAQDIVREREAHGPFRSVDDLQRVKGLGASRIAELRDRVTT